VGVVVVVVVVSGVAVRLSHCIMATVAVDATYYVAGLLC